MDQAAWHGKLIGAELDYALPTFDPIDRPGRVERPTLLDEIFFHVGHCGHRNREALKALLNRDRTESFGRELLLAHLTNPIDEPVNTADLFQSSLAGIRKLLTASLARTSKAMKADPELRRQYLIDVLAAPQPRYNLNFEPQWQKDKVATAEEILEWEEALLKTAPRSGNTANQLSWLASEQQQPDRALTLADRAITDAGKIRLLRSRFQIEKAKLLGALGRPEEGVTFLKEAMASPKFQPDMKTKASEALAELEAK